jgi:hypothetical protein
MNHTDPVSRVLLTARGIQPRTELPVAEAVTGRWSAVKQRLPVPGEGFRGLQSRAEPKVIRLAAAYALADRATEIGAAHVDAALAVLAYCARSAEIVFGVPVAQLPPRVDPRQTARIVRHLHDAYPGWVARSELGGDDHALADLVAKRLIERRKAPAEEYRLVAPQMLLFP